MNPHYVLAELRGGIPPKSYRDVLSWLPTLPNRRSRALNPSFPSTYTALMPQFVLLNALSIERELQWATARILNHQDKIGEFIEIKRQLEVAWIDSDYSRVEDLLDQIESTFGVSLFLIELRLAVLQEQKGLERQKSFTATVREKSSSGIVRFITYFLSQKNEKATNPILFTHRVERAIAALEVPKEFKHYLRYRVLRDLPTQISALTGVLRAEANSSIIDQYETLLLVLSEAASEPENGRASLSDLTNSISDERLRRIGLLYGIADPKVFEAIRCDLSVQSLLDFEHSQEALARIPDPPPQCIYMSQIVTEALARADTGSNLASPHSTRRMELIYLLSSIAAKEEGYEDDLFDLLRLLECYCALSFADILRPAVLELASVTYYLTDAQRRRYVVADPHVNVVAIPVIHPIHLQDYLACLKDSNYSIGSASHIPENGESLLQLPLRWRLFEDDDKALLLETEVGYCSAPQRLRRQIIRRRIHAFLSLGEIASAIECIVSSYIEDPQILMMLPITRCAGLIDDTDPDTMGDPLTLAIVYDLYLRHCGDDRPYIRSDAYEDFLAARDIEHPSELQVLHFEPEKHRRVIYFLRYVCIPEVMSNSEHFDGSKSIDSERLKICSLLLEVDPGNAQVYKKELKDITRKQVVSQGLRDVEQSKFAIDVEPLRKWADKNMKESFARFQALRLAGVKASTAKLASSSGDGIQIPDSPSDEIATLLNEMLV